MATGWLKGTVKAVPNGDTLVIMGGPRSNGPPLEKSITLASLIAPRLGKRDGSTPDEPFAWASREFLRTLTIGKPCSFKVHYTLENVPGREFGSVFVDDVNIALQVVSNGWAKVRPSGGSQSPYYDELAAAQAAAEGQGLGVFNKTPEALAKAVRSSEGIGAVIDPTEFEKGAALPAIVEQVNSGSSVRITLLEGLRPVGVLVCGITCPSMGRKGLPAKDGADAVPEVPPEPFALQARHFTETRVLHREVRVLFRGVDKFGNVIGSIIYPVGDQPTDLAIELVKGGLAKTVEWGLNMMSDGEKLRSAERAAKSSKLGQWKNWTPPPSNQTKMSDKFTGHVVEVVSGDCLIIRDSASQAERRVNLSSIRAPRLGRKGEQPEPWAVEAKEFLRQRLIGKEVSVSMEYHRKVGGPDAAAAPATANGAAAPAGDVRVMAFGSVLLSEKDPGGGPPRQNNVAELLLIRGLGTTVKHRTDEERSAHFESLLEAEQAGKAKKKGVHGNKESNVPHVNDLSVPGSGSRAKAHLAFLQRGKQNGVVEHIASGHRLKVLIPKEGVTIAFSPSGVRTPQPGRPARPGFAATKEEPFWQEALAFTRRHCMQRDVELEIETVDRLGTFLGTLKLAGKPFNLGLALLEAGLGKLHPNFDPDRIVGGRELASAEAAAKEARLKVWEAYETPSADDEAELANGSAAYVNGSAPETASVLVSDIVDATDFSLQMAEEKRLGFIEEQLVNAGESASKVVGVLKLGDLCVAQFSADKQWYRASVEKVVNSDPVNPTYNVVFIDYGNRETVKGENVRVMEPALAAIAAQAHPASLAYVKVATAEDEIGLEAAERFSQLTGGNQKLKARIEWKEGAPKGWGTKAKAAGPVRLHVVLLDPEDPALGKSINAQLVSEGLAKVAAPAKKGPAAARGKDVLEALQEAEQQARRKHLGIWEYGDPGSDEEAEAPPSHGRGGGARK